MLILSKRHAVVTIDIRYIERSISFHRDENCLDKHRLEQVGAYPDDERNSSKEGLLSKRRRDHACIAPTCDFFANILQPKSI